MMFQLMTLDDETDITYSELLADGRVKVYVEKADEKDGFHNMSCYLPNYEVVDVYGFSQDEVNKYINIIRNAHILKKYDRDFIQGGIGNV